MLPGLPAPLRFPANPAFHTGLKSKAPGVSNAPGAFRFRDTLNKLLNASAFPPSFLQKQEPKTLWAAVPAFLGTTGRVQYPGHGLIQRFPEVFGHSDDRNRGKRPGLIPGIV